MQHSRHLVLASLAMLIFGFTARAESLAIVEADPGDVPVSQMLATGLFSSVTDIDAASSTPTLAQLSSYGAILAYTNYEPNDGTALGNVLADYYALGGKALTIATYGLSNPWEIGGAVMTGDDAALTNLGTNGSVSGNLVATVPSDPIFNGIDLATFTYFYNGNFANPGLATGATLLATDGAGVDMIARSEDGIVNVNLFPGVEGNGDNPQVYQLLAQTLTPSTTSTIPEPGTLMLFGTALLGVAGILRRKRAMR